MGRFLVSLVSLGLAPLAWAAPVTFNSPDGVQIAAEHTGKGERGVVLVHANGGSRDDWSSLVGRLNDVQVLSVDLRGHGKSKGSPDAVASVADVNAAVAYLRARGAKKITVVGVGLGANLALASTIKDPAIEGVVMLSPALNASGVRASEALPTLGQRPLLLVAGADDNLSLKAANMIADNATNAKVQVVANGGSGMAMFHRATELEGSLVAWVHGSHAVADGDLSPQMKVSTDFGEVQTTGTKLGEKRP